MEHEAVLAEMQALLASLKSTLSEDGETASGLDSGLDPNADAAPESSTLKNQSQQLSGDLLPDCRSLRRFVLMV